MDRETLVLITEMHTDIKHLVKTVESHMIQDDVRFKKIDEDNDFLKKVVYGGIGIIIFVEFLTKFIK